jgi:hypothetical protein
MSHKSTPDQSQGEMFPQRPIIFLAPLTSQTSSWVPSLGMLSSSAPLCKRKQSANRDAVTGPAFLVPLFDRDDYLLARNESEDKNEEEENGSNEIKIDSRLLQQASNFDVGSNRLPTSKRSSQSQKPSPRWQPTIRSIHLTQLTSRQSVVNTTRIHPNSDIGNLFGHLPFSSSIRNNHYSAHVQDTQIRNLSLPVWAMLPINTVPGPGSLGCAFSTFLQEAASLRNTGVSIEQIIETQPNLAALFDEHVFKASGILSKWAVGMVHSVFLEGIDQQFKWR